MKLFKAIAQNLHAHIACVKTGSNLAKKYLEEITKLEELLPSGNGFSDPKIIIDNQKPNIIKIKTQYHHMTNHGFYDGWTSHIVTVKPSLSHEVELTISGRNKNNIKDFIHEVFYDALIKEI